MYEDFYYSLAKKINRTLNRRAISARKIASIVEQAKRVRARKGVMGLWQFASQLPTQFFTEHEIERLKATSEWELFTRQMIQLLIQERVITSFEAQMLARYI